MRNLLTKTFDDAGYKTASAVDGLDLLNKIYTERPDCVIVYIDLPIISGYNISRILKNSQFRNTGVIICATEENSVYKFWAENSMSNALMVPNEGNLERIPNLVERVLSECKKKNVDDAPKKRGRPQKPTQEDIINLAIKAFDRELFDLYVIKSAYNGGNIDFNIARLIREMVKTLSGIHSYDALGIIVNTDTPMQFYSRNYMLADTEMEDFICVCQTDFASKTLRKDSINWQKSPMQELDNSISPNTGRLKNYEAFPTESKADSVFTIHVANTKSDAISGRTRERLNFLVSVYSKIVNHAISYNKMDLAEKKMHRAFSHFLPPKIISEIINEEETATSTVGEKRDVAVLICDIRNFTMLSELNAAEDVVEFLNQYFAIMCSIIKKHGGTIDKFMGDAIMALFGAPESYEDNGNRAANAALEMRRALGQLKIDLKMPKGYVFDIGTGIHYGTTIVGSIGSEEKKEYTVIGDNVNIASRIEGLTKIYGTPIIISESVKRDLHDGQYTRHLDNVKVKGKSVSVAIYELSFPETCENPDFIELYGKGMNQYVMGNFQLASDYFLKATEIKPTDKAAKILLERCKTYAKDRPENWDGSFALTTK